LVRVAHNYGGTPEFVLIGGLVPELLCHNSGMHHAGTTDIDVQVDLEIASGSVNAPALERALRNSEFEPDPQRPWRWITVDYGSGAEIKFELLCDSPNHPAPATLLFDGTSQLGAANLRGTGAATRDFELRGLESRIGGVVLRVQLRVAGTAGFLMAKSAAAHHRQQPRDWYDIAFVLCHGEPTPKEAAALVETCFGRPIPHEMQTDLHELVANFERPDLQGPAAYAEQLILDHPERDDGQSRADAVVAVREFCTSLL
jgi:hypothetical protein